MNTDKSIKPKQGVFLNECNTLLRGKVALFAFTEDNVGLIPPFALMLLADQLRKHGYEPHINHFRRSEIDIDNIVADVSKCLFVGFSLLTGGLLISALSLSKAIKDKYGDQIAIVWGGIHTTLCSEITLKEDCIDYIIMGEGEDSICKLASYLKNGKKGDLNAIPGLGFKEDGKLRFNQREMLEHLEPYSYSWDLIDIERYIQPNYGYQRVLPYISSKGCPFNCSFCYNLAFNNRKWRGRSAEKVILDILYLKERYGIDAIEFYDDYFFANRKRAEEIIKAIDLPWHAELRASDINSDRIRYLKNLKAVGFFFGAESGSKKVLKGLNKKISPSDIYNAAKVCHEERIFNLRCSFLMYTPIEEYKDVRETVLLIIKMIRNYPFVVIGIGHYTPYPGVELINKMKEKGWQEPDSTIGWSQYHRQTPPENMGIFNSNYLKKTQKLKEAALSIVNLYKFFDRLGTFGTIVRLTLWPFALISDYFFHRGILLYPIETFLFKFLYIFKRLFAGKNS